MTEAFEQAAKTRIQAIATTPEARRQALAQHLTPPEVATLAAGMFSDADGDLQCLDLGGGTGILSAALLERYGDQVKRLDTIEMDETLAAIYDDEIRTRVNGTTLIGDAITADIGDGYDRIILNPPYKKMAADDPRQEALPAHSANLYAAFMMRAVDLLAAGGEVVAIVPRSWTNGDYFTPFRRYVLGKCSLDALHVYGSRNEVFADTNVLQETMIVRLSKRKEGQAASIRVSQSAGKGSKITTADYPAEELIVGDTMVVRIEPPTTTNLTMTIEEASLCPSTGKVVDFRSRGYITVDKPVNRLSVPLIYAGNFPNGELEHPLQFGKGQWFCLDDDWATKQVCEPGAYVVVRRFSAKEEKRRVVAYPLVVDKPVALENHTTFIHAGRPRKVIPLRSAALARGIAIWLNTTFIDEWFRGVSGSTQVNAGDIKKMPCPALDALEKVGGSWHGNMTQEETDKICEVLL